MQKVEKYQTTALPTNRSIIFVIKYICFCLQKSSFVSWTKGCLSSYAISDELKFIYFSCNTDRPWSNILKALKIMLTLAQLLDLWTIRRRSIREQSQDRWRKWAKCWSTSRRAWECRKSKRWQSEVGKLRCGQGRRFGRWFLLVVFRVYQWQYCARVPEKLIFLVIRLGKN